MDLSQKAAFFINVLIKRESFYWLNIALDVLNPLKFTNKYLQSSKLRIVEMRIFFNGLKDIFKNKRSEQHFMKFLIRL